MASWRAANVPFGELFHRVKIYELAPPGYYVVLHFWIRIFGSDSVVVMRSLSVVAALGLVVAIWWLARMLAGGWVALAAALLAAISPLVLEYGQEVRAYMWTMLLVTVATGCLVRARGTATRQGHWLTAGWIASALALWFHYSALLVIAPLTVWLLFTSQISRLRRSVFAAGLVLAGVPLLPLIHAQLARGNQNAVAAVAQLSWVNVERVGGALYDRTYNILSPVDAAIGGVLAVVAIGLLLLPRAAKRVKHPQLIAALAACAPLTLILLTAVGRPELVSRYDAVVVPFMAIAVAASLSVFLPAGLLVAGLAFYLALPASIAAHTDRYAYPDTRAAVRFVARHWQRGDILVFGAGYPAYPFSLQYYVAHLLPSTARVGYIDSPKLLHIAISGKWAPGIAMITVPEHPLAVLGQDFARVGFRVTAATQIGGTVPLQVVVTKRQS